MAIDPLYVFVFLGLFTPGPNVILLTASGARFGFRATLPHVAGVVVGVGVTAALTGLGVGALIVAVPMLTFVLKLVAAGWIGWMAWKLLQSRGGQMQAGDNPFTFWQAVLFQWVNAKVWAIAVAASAGYGIGLDPWAEALRLGSAFSGLNLFVCLFWSFAGSLLTYLLTTPRAWRIFTTLMAAALAMSALMVFL